MKALRPLKNLHRSFRMRLFVALSLMIFIFIPVTGYFSYRQALKAVENQMQHYAISTASQISERIRQFLSQHMDTARLIKAFMEKGMIRVNNQQELVGYFNLLKQDHPAFVNVYFGEQNGDFTMVPPQRPEIHKVFDPRSRPWYRGAAAAGGPHWTDVYLFASTQSPGITASVPIYDNSGALLGVCGIDIDLSTFSRFLQTIKIENQGYAYIIENRYGRVIAHPDLVCRTWDSLHLQLLSTCLTELKAAGRQFGLTAFQGAYFFTAYVDYPQSDWTVGVTLPMTEFLSHVQTIKKTTVSMAVVGMVLAAMLSYLITLTIVNPLKALRQGIERISDGDMDHKVYPTNLDIADALALSFNQMAASLKESRSALKQTYIELAEKEKMAALGHMTASIAHELKNPLGVILGSAQVVANSDRPLAMREEAARFIVDETERLDNTLRAFLAFARPASPVFVPVNMIQILEDLLAAIESQMNAKGITVVKQLDGGSPPCLADKDQIRQVFWNILLNAMQAMREGGCLTIAASAGDRPGHAAVLPGTAGSSALVVTISDNGPGIAPELIDTIFDPFVSHREDGVGLGLSIVRQILRLHSADIRVTSPPGGGACFTVTFNCSKDRP